MSASQQPFETWSSSFNEQDWTLLGALASERALPQSVLEKLSPEPALPAAVWLKRALAADWVSPVRATRGSSLKPHFSVHPEYRERVLRRLAETGELTAIARVMRALLTVRSVSDLTLSLQQGALADFQRRFAARKHPSELGPATRAEWLRSSICEPFDPHWLNKVWQADAWRVASLVLEECLSGPVGCDELLAWLAEQSEILDDPEDRFGLRRALYSHAILRGQLEPASELELRLPAQSRLVLSVPLRFLEGNLPDARARLAHVLSGSPGSKRGTFVDCGALAPLLALLICTRDDDDAHSAAKRVLSASSGELNRGALRALRTLFKFQTEPPEEQRRLDAHQLSEDASAWEILILALTVHLHSVDQWGRASWCLLLVQRALRFQAAGYAWLARQTLFLARILHEEQYAAELAKRAGTAPELGHAPNELVLWELFSSKPEWQKTLEALSEISQSTSDERVQNRRLAWFVDMTSGALSRPSVQEFRPAEGWTEGRRASLAEVWPLYEELPKEDQHVLDCTNEVKVGGRDFNADAPEALIGHPRVINGVRRVPVDVVRATCRVETREERGYVHLHVEPAGAELGVNVVPQGETRLAVYRVTPAMQRVIGALRGGTRVPKSHERELLQVLAKLSESVDVHSPELGSERTVEADSTPCLRFAVHAGAWLVQLGVRPFAERGRFFLAGSGRASLSSYVNGQRLRCERDLDLERAKIQTLCQACPTLAPQDPDERSSFDALDSWTLGEEGVLSLLSELRDSHLSCALEWPESGGLRLSAHARSSALHGRLRVDKGWYLVTGGLRVDEVTEVALSELARAPMLAGGRFLRLANGDFVEVEARVRRVLAALRAATAGKRAGAELRVPKHALHTLSELADREMGFEIDAEGQAWLARVAELERKDFALPETLRATLRPYQLEGFRWLSYLSELGLGACLADDMGLGKTVQILALLLVRAAEGQGPALVVAPTSVCGNWIAELARFAPTLHALEYVGKDRVLALAKLSSDSVVVCSYTLLQQDQAELAARSFGTVVLDEAQFIKNAQSLRAKAAFSLSAKQRIAATGTPVENHLGDLWSIFQFLNPGMLGDWPHFRRTFLMPVERDGSREATELLRKLVKPFVLRRLKRDVLSDLPPITEVQHDVHWSEDETLRYGMLRRQIHEKLYTSHGKRFNKIEVLAEIMRLRRFCCHPSLVFPDAPNECSKLDAFLELVEELRENQHRALVFSQFVDFLGLVRERLDERGINYEYLDGSTPMADRQVRVAAFQSGHASLFLISLKAGGFGLNLTAADYVIHLDPWWNPAVEAQATDRAHRIGQDKPVTVYRLITRHSIEESILKLHEKKREIAQSLLAGGDAAGSLSADELLELVKETVS